MPSGVIRLSRPPGCQGIEDHFPFQVDALPAVRPAVFQHQVDPLLEEGWRTVHEKGMVPDHDVMASQKGLLPIRVDVEIGIGLVEIVEGDVRHALDSLEQGAIDPRLFKPGMGK